MEDIITYNKVRLINEERKKANSRIDYKDIVFERRIIPSKVDPLDLIREDTIEQENMERRKVIDFVEGFNEKLGNETFIKKNTKPEEKKDLEPNQLVLYEINEQLKRSSDLKQDTKNFLALMAENVINNIYINIGKGTTQKEANVIYNVMVALVDNIVSNKPETRIQFVNVMKRFNEAVNKNDFNAIRAISADVINTIKFVSAADNFKSNILRNVNVYEGRRSKFNEYYNEFVRILNLFNNFVSPLEFDKIKTLRDTISDDLIDLEDEGRKNEIQVITVSYMLAVSKVYKELQDIYDDVNKINDYFSESVHSRVVKYMDSSLSLAGMKRKDVDYFFNLSGRGQLKKVLPIIGSGYNEKVFVLNKEDALDKLNRIISSITAGNNNIDMIQDGFSINDYLLHNKQIDKKKHQEIWSLLNYGKN